MTDTEYGIECMNGLRVFPMKAYFRKVVNSFVPRFIFRLSPVRYWQRNHWKTQKEGDIHGYDKYTVDHPRVPVFLHELKNRAGPSDSILDLGCNCGYYLHLLKKEGYTNLNGIDISGEAVRFGKEHYDLSGVEIIVGSFEDTLPALAKRNGTFRVVYSLGATLELVHPSFDIIGHLCRISSGYIILMISEWGHAYPRFWEYEFNRNGFLLVEYRRPFDGSRLLGDPLVADSLMVFQRARPCLP